MNGKSVRRALIVIAALVAASCSSGSSDPTTATSTTTTPQTTDAPSYTTTAPALASFTLQDHIDWFVGGLNGEPVTAAEVEAHTDESMRAEVPVDQFLSVFDQLAGTWTILEQEVAPNGREATVFASSEAGRFKISMATEAVAPNRLIGALIQPAPEPPASPEALPSRLLEFAPIVEFVVADVTNGSCDAVAGELSERRRPIGSIFKLWVLGALADAVADGSMAWDDVLPISDDLKSLPTGTMQDEPAGTEFTLAEYAAAMISISDNTATDHLINHLGRQAVEEAQARYGHGDPDVNRPFLTTADLFALRGLASDDEVARYAGGDVAERLAILDDIEGDLADIDIQAFLAAPGAIEDIGWFGSMGDVCRALVALDGVSRQPGQESVWDALSINPGVRIDPTVFPRVGFKGGSEPGVLALSWVVERTDGRRFVIAASLADPSETINELGAITLLETVFPLLAEV